jgi:hypothetical protein
MIFIFYAPRTDIDSISLRTRSLAVVSGDFVVRIAIATFILSIGVLAVIGGTATHARTTGLKSKPTDSRMFQPPAQQAVRLRYYGGPKSPMYP